MTEKALFTEEINGYDRRQVDEYVHKISEAYQAAYNENQELRGKCDALSEKCRKLETPDQGKSHSNIIAKALLDAEILAQKIIDDAHSEADGLKTEAQKIIDDARNEADSLKEQIQRAKNDVYIEQTHTKIQAQKIIDGANLEASEIAAQTKKNLEQVLDIFGQTLRRVQNLLTVNSPDERAADAENNDSVL